MTTTLFALVHRRWSLPVLAHFQALGGGARFVQLRAATGMSKDAASTTLKHLAALGLVAKKSAFAHPLTPEYTLSPRGALVAPAAAALMSPLIEDDLERLALKKWSLPILHTLEVPAPFTALKAQLPITPRALSLSLRDLERAALVDDVAGGYRRGARAAELSAPLRALTGALDSSSGAL